jgi:hypothetical protein
MEGPVGLEPTTRGLKGHCSNQLSYGPEIKYGLKQGVLSVFLTEKSITLYLLFVLFVVVFGHFVS